MVQPTGRLQSFYFDHSLGWHIIRGDWLSTRRFEACLGPYANRALSLSSPHLYHAGGGATQVGPVADARGRADLRREGDLLPRRAPDRHATPLLYCHALLLYM